LKFRIDRGSGVPFYRQVIEQTQSAITSGELQPGDQLPTVRQLAVELSINPNTVIRAYRELEIKGVLDTQQGSGTYVGSAKPAGDPQERRRILDQIVTEMLARASDYGFSLDEIARALKRRKETTS